VNPTLLLVHSPVVGPTTWAETATRLQRKGFRCVVPDLTKVVPLGPPFYQRLAAAAARGVSDGGSVVLIGHSAAGALVPAIAEAVVGPVRAVFVDAQLPRPGLSFFDTAPPPMREQLRAMAEDGVLPPWNEWFPPGALEELMPDAVQRRKFVVEIPRLPLAFFDELAPMTRRLGRRWACLRFSAAYDDAADEAERRGWWVARRNWDHLRMLTDPEAVADLIAQAISATAPT
jgi:Alpha/beta hydrolase family